MSTITKEFTKEQLQQIEAAAKEVMWPVVWSEKKAREHFSEKITPKVVLKLARIALASLEAEPAIHRWRRVTVEPYGPYPWHYGNFIGFSQPVDGIEDEYFYSAPPAPVSVPAAMEMDDDFDSAFEHGKAVGWNAYRDAMLKHSEPFIVTSDHRMMEMPQVEAINAVTAILQGADGTLTNEGTIPVTQFKPVADLYGLTSPTGGETSFTFDAVEARDFIDGGWSCQEYVELGRFQEAMLQNGNSPAQSDCCPEQNYIAPAQDGDSPVIPDGWVLVPVEPTEEMNKAGWTAMNEHDAINPTYRAMLAAAPQQEADNE